MLVLDTKDSSGLVNVFKIRHGKETHVYRTETSGDKKSLLAQFRSVAEELQQKRRREREGEHERRKTVWSASDKTGDEWMKDLVRRVLDASRARSIPRCLSCTMIRLPAPTDNACFAYERLHSLSSAMSDMVLLHNGNH